MRRGVLVKINSVEALKHSYSFRWHLQKSSPVNHCLPVNHCPWSINACQVLISVLFEKKVERVSCGVITPSAALGVLEALYWKPQICRIIDGIHILKPI